jgi:hypothetical protein
VDQENDSEMVKIETENFDDLEKKLKNELNNKGDEINGGNLVNAKVNDNDINNVDHNKNKNSDNNENPTEKLQSNDQNAAAKINSGSKNGNENVENIKSKTNENQEYNTAIANSKYERGNEEDELIKVDRTTGDTPEGESENFRKPDRFKSRFKATQQSKSKRTTSLEALLDEEKQKHKSKIKHRSKAKQRWDRLKVRM